MLKPAEDHLCLDQIIDPVALRESLDALAAEHGGASIDARQAVLAEVKRVNTLGRETARTMLFDDGGGTACAIRISYLQDVITNALYDYARIHVYRVENPSTSERMTVTAVGGYGRGTLAPGSDIDLLFVLPYKKTPWTEQVVEWILYILWDMGLKVGHATRNVDECIRLARSDMTIRTAILETRFICGEQTLFKDLATASTTRWLRAPAPNSSPPNCPNGTSATTRQETHGIWSSPMSRKARAVCAISTRCSGSPSTSTTSATQGS